MNKNLTALVSVLLTLLAQAPSMAGDKHSEQEVEDILQTLGVTLGSCSAPAQAQIRVDGLERTFCARPVPPSFPPGIYKLSMSDYQLYRLGGGKVTLSTDWWQNPNAGGGGNSGGYPSQPPTPTQWPVQTGPWGGTTQPVMQTAQDQSPFYNLGGGAIPPYVEATLRSVLAGQGLRPIGCSQAQVFVYVNDAYLACSTANAEYGPGKYKFDIKGLNGSSFY